ncbi:hypothetical protein [Streptomyces sp. FH025]|uniref:hypothetical protein n=1 Tax=Streptomyces sp. FH025 TaxID=2815937 RepID=UPI001A9FC95C|nr:hypothetical protein [Streptomyces sp. FH025]MBO1414213.1 hypothetical protein [Streptomyces sp. FH025]
MSVIAAFHSVGPGTRRHGHGLRAAFARVLERLAASPLDSSVLGAMGAPRSTARPAPAPAPRPAKGVAVR